MGNLLDCAAYSDLPALAEQEVAEAKNNGPEEGGDGGKTNNYPSCNSVPAVQHFALTATQSEALKQIREGSPRNLKVDPPENCSTTIEENAEPQINSPREIPVVRVPTTHPQDDSIVGKTENWLQRNTPNRKKSSILTQRKTSDVNILDEDIPLSDSSLWDLQRKFYVERNINCWNGNQKSIVPNFVTSNCFIASSYARIALDFVRDLDRANQLDFSEPLYIIEVGSGSGKLGCQIARRFLKFEKFLPKEKGTGKRLNVKVIITDFSQEIIDFWMQHPPLVELMHMNKFDVAIFDAETSHEPINMYLQFSNQNISLPTKNPVVGICNYVFDTITQDAFQIREQKLYRGLSTVHLKTGSTNKSIFLDGLQKLAPGLNNSIQQKTEPAVSKDEPLKHGNALRTAQNLFSFGRPSQSKSEDYNAPSSPRAMQEELTSADVISCTWKYVPLDLSNVIHSVQDEHSADKTIDERKDKKKQKRNRNLSGLERFEQYSLKKEEFDRERVLGLYDDPNLEKVILAILKELCNNEVAQEASSVLVPIGGMNVIQKFAKLSNGRTLILAGDKGYNRCIEFSCLRDPHIALHGSFSFMVNFYLLRRFVEMVYGAKVLYTPFHDGFKCNAFYLYSDINRLDSTLFPTPQEQQSLHKRVNNLFKRSIASFAHMSESFGPEQFSTLQRCIKEECANPSLRHALALLRLGNGDQDVFFKFRHVFIDRVASPFASEPVQHDTKIDIEAVLENYYPLHINKDISFELGRLHMALKDYDSAITLFEKSNTECGAHYVTYHNIGICHYYKKNFEVSKKYFDQSLEIHSGYKEALEWLEKVEQCMNVVQ